MFATATLQRSGNPYVGLRPFETGDTLYGRDRELLELFNVLIAERIVLLYSPSGAGKTSLIQAGLIPALREEGFDVLPPMRVSLVAEAAAERSNGSGNSNTNRFVRSLILSLEKEQTTPSELASTDLITYLDERVMQPGLAGTVLIFDQFEEILSIDPSNQKAKQEFFEHIGIALSKRNRWALFAMREDYLGALDPYRRWVPTRFNTRFRLDLLTKAEAREAIQRPALAMGVTFTEEAADKLINDLSMVFIQQPDGSVKEQQGPYVEPVQLQVVCSRLWEKLPLGTSVIEKSYIEGIKDVNSALAGYYRDSVEAVSLKTGASEWLIRRWFDEQLINEQGIRGQVLRAPQSSGGLDNKAIMALVDVHLVRKEERRNATWFELAHDRLIAPVRRDNREWREENASPLQRQAALWESRGRPATLLLRGSELVAATNWSTTNEVDLFSSEKEFLQISQATERESVRSQRIRLVLLGLFVFVFAVVAVAALLVFNAQGETIKQRDEAQKQRSTAVAQSTFAAEQQRIAVAESTRANSEAASAIRAKATAEAESIRANSEATSAIRNEQTAQAQSTVAINERNRANVAATAAIQNQETAVAQSTVAAQERLNALEAGTIALANERLAIDERNRANAAATMSFQNQQTAVAESTLAASERNRANLAATAASDQRSIAQAQSTVAINERNRANVAATAAIQNQETAVAQSTVAAQQRATAVAQSTVSFQNQQTAVAESTRAANERNRANVAATAAIQNQETAVAQSTVAAERRNEAQQQSTIAAQQKETAVAERNIADSRALASQGLLTLDSQLDLALLLSAQAGRIEDTLEARNSLVTGLQYSPYLETYLRSNTGQLNSVAFSPTGKWLASGSVDGTITLWDLGARPSTSRTFKGHTAGVTNLVFSHDGTVLASGSCGKPLQNARCGGGEVRVWDVNTGGAVPRRQWSGQNDEVKSLDFSPDDTMLVVGGDGIVLWDIWAEPLVTYTLVDHLAVNSVAFSHDGKTLAAGTLVGGVTLWDVASRTQSNTPLKGHSVSVQSVAFSPDDRTLASASWDQTIILWDVASGTQSGETLKGHTREVESVAFSRDGKTLVSGSRDQTLIVWDILTHKPLGPPLRGHRDIVKSVAFSPDGHSLASGSPDRTAILWDIATLRPISGHSGAVNSVAFSPDGTILASGSADHNIILWDIKANPPSGQTLSGHSNVVSSVTFSPDGKTLASASWDQTVLLWSLETRAPIAALRHRSRVTSVAFSPDGKVLASGSCARRSNGGICLEGEVRLWDAVSRAELTQGLRGHTGEVLGVAFSPDGKILATAGADSTVILWNLSTDPPRSLPLAGHRDAVTSVAFNHDGSRVAGGSRDHTIIMWDVTNIKWDVTTVQPTGTPEATSRQIGVPLVGHTNWVDGVAFSPDGRTLASASWDHTVRLWDVDTHRSLGSPLHGPTNVVLGVAFSPDSRRIAAASADRTIIIRDAYPQPADRACERANRNLTSSEWAQYLGSKAYQKTCPNIP